LLLVEARKGVDTTTLPKKYAKAWKLTTSIHMLYIYNIRTFSCGLRLFLPWLNRNISLFFFEDSHIQI
jgi:hypothetical protein